MRCRSSCSSYAPSISRAGSVPVTKVVSGGVVCSLRGAGASPFGHELVVFIVSVLGWSSKKFLLQIVRA